MNHLIFFIKINNLIIYDDIVVIQIYDDKLRFNLLIAIGRLADSRVFAKL